MREKQGKERSTTDVKGCKKTERRGYKDGEAERERRGNGKAEKEE